MTKTIGLLLILVCALACITQEGVMLSNGKITPCNGWHNDNQACGNALFNSKQLAFISLGQTPAEVRAIMRHDAERREAALGSDGKRVETWNYITDYDAEQMTTFTFIDGRLTQIGNAAWKAQK